MSGSVKLDPALNASDQATGAALHKMDQTFKNGSLMRKAGAKEKSRS